VTGDNVLAIGKFESIHLGHRALINEATRLARQNGLDSAIMVLSPHPYTVLVDANYKPLFTEDERAYLLVNFGLDHVFVQPFDKGFAEIAPQDFCRKIFLDFRARVVVVGEGYSFGRNRAGDIALLRQEAKAFGAEVRVVPHCTAADEAISTSQIRNLLLANKLPEAEQLLGFPFFAMGTTRQGRQLARTLGCPTLNLYPHPSKFLPADGVYATLTYIDDIPHSGLTNIGLRPTVSQDNTRSVETHLLNVKMPELYGTRIKIEFLHFIRPEKKFASIDELKAQIKLDIRGMSCIL